MPVFKALKRETAFPSPVRGPVDLSALAQFAVSPHTAGIVVSIGALFNGGHGSREAKGEAHVYLLAGNGDLLDGGQQEVTPLAPVGDLSRPRHLAAEFAEALRLRRLASRCNGFQPPFGLPPPLGCRPQVIPKSRERIRQVG